VSGRSGTEEIPPLFPRACVTGRPAIAAWGPDGGAQIAITDKAKMNMGWPASWSAVRQDRLHPENERINVVSRITMASNVQV